MRASAPLRERVGSVPVTTTVFPASAPPDARFSAVVSPTPAALSRSSSRAVDPRAKKETTAAALSGPDFVDGAELLLGRLRERVKRAEGLGQQLSGLFTDVPDAERVQEFGKRRGLGAFNRGNQVGGALFGEALQRRKVGSFQ